MTSSSSPSSAAPLSRVDVDDESAGGGDLLLGPSKKKLPRSRSFSSVLTTPFQACPPSTIDAEMLMALASIQQSSGASASSGSLKQQPEDEDEEDETNSKKKKKNRRKVAVTPTASSLFPTTPEEIDAAFINRALIIPHDHVVTSVRVVPTGTSMGFLPETHRVYLSYDKSGEDDDDHLPNSVIVKILPISEFFQQEEEDEQNDDSKDDDGDNRMRMMLTTTMHKFAARIHEHVQIPRALHIAMDEEKRHILFVFEDFAVNAKTMKPLCRFHGTGIKDEDVIAASAVAGELHAAFWEDAIQDTATATTFTSSSPYLPLSRLLHQTHLLPTRNVTLIAELCSSRVLSSAVLASLPPSWIPHAAAAMELAPLIQNYISSDVTPKTLLHHDLRGDNQFCVLGASSSTSTKPRLAFTAWPYAGMGMPLLDLAWLVVTASDTTCQSENVADLHLACLRSYWCAVAEARGAERLANEYPFCDALEDYHIAILWCFLVACQSVPPHGVRRSGDEEGKAAALVGEEEQCARLMRRILKCVVRLQAVQVATCRILAVLDLIAED